MQEAAEDLALAIQTCEEIAGSGAEQPACTLKTRRIFITKTGNLDAALSHYQYLLDTAPQFDEEITLKIGLLYFEQENFADAEVLFRRITGENPGNQHAHYYLGHSL